MREKLIRPGQASISTNPVDELCRLTAARFLAPMTAVGVLVCAHRDVGHLATVEGVE